MQALRQVRRRERGNVKSLGRSYQQFAGARVSDDLRIPDHGDITGVGLGSPILQHLFDVLPGHFKVQGAWLALDIEAGLEQLGATAVESQRTTINRLP